MKMVQLQLYLQKISLKKEPDEKNLMLGAEAKPGKEMGWLIEVTKATGYFQNFC